MQRVIVDPIQPDLAALEPAAFMIRSGGIVAMPTDTLYGLAADPFDTDAVARIFAIKGRDAARPLPLIAADREQVAARIGLLSTMSQQLAARFWPGPLTLLLAAPAGLADNVTGGTGTVGIRVPAHAVARALCRICTSPLTATSANLSGYTPLADPDEVERALRDRIDVLIDAGPTPGGPSSTIVDATGSSLRLVRAGAIAWPDILASVQGLPSRAG
ncbi:MAG: threonylcarbamoyl-AMP synthase [Blastocatellia bacterium]|nr:MAG: threonylcarbamoyl-AMP synthase [Blastocatellia bacterium]